MKEKDIKQKQIPCVVSGKGYGIIDDCGGTYRLQQIAKIANFESEPDDEQYFEWVDFDFVNLSDFDKDELNELLIMDFEYVKNLYENPDYFE